MRRWRDEEEVERRGGGEMRGRRGRGDSLTLGEDLIIFPEEAQFVRATANARVFLLKFTSGRKLFFWLQEPKDDKDKEYEEKTNQFINNPPSPEQAGDVPHLH